MRIVLAIFLLFNIFFAWLCLSGFGPAGSLMLMGGSSAAESPAGDYDDIIWYHNCDSLATTPTKGAGTLKFDVGILLETTDPITGTGSWDNNNDGWDKVRIYNSGINYDNATIGFYWRPYENDSGLIVWDDNRDLALQYTKATEMVFGYKDQLVYFAQDMSTFDGSVEYYIEVIMTGTTATVKINGVQKASVSGASGTITGNLNFGALDGRQWWAMFDQIMISNSTSRDLYALRDTTNVD